MNAPLTFENRVALAMACAARRANLFEMFAGYHAHGQAQLMTYTAQSIAELNDAQDRISSAFHP